MQNENTKIKCTECENDFDLDTTGVEVGDILECPVCGANLEVINSEPLQVAPVTTYK